MYYTHRIVLFIYYSVNIVNSFEHSLFDLIIRFNIDVNAKGLNEHKYRQYHKSFV